MEQLTLDECQSSRTGDDEPSIRHYGPPVANLRGGFHAPKPELRPGSPVCECATCGKFFTNVSPFDRHLIGATTARVRCMSTKRMLAIGMTQNEYGCWNYGVSAKKARGEK